MEVDTEYQTKSEDETVEEAEGSLKIDTSTSDNPSNNGEDTKDSDGTSSQKSSSSEHKSRKNKRKSHPPTKATTGALKIEMKRPKAMKVNTSDRPYVCVTCFKSFTRSHHLTRHEYSHTGERPYICGTCGKTFIRKHKLTVHIRSHTGEKPFACSVCAKGFSSSEKRKLHERIHSGEKPYPCDSCEKCFKSSSQLKRHLETHKKREEFEQNEEFGCSICYKVFVSEYHLSNHKAKHDKKAAVLASTEPKTGCRKRKPSAKAKLDTNESNQNVKKSETSEQLPPISISDAKKFVSRIKIPSLSSERKDNLESNITTPAPDKIILETNKSHDEYVGNIVENIVRKEWSSENIRQSIDTRPIPPIENLIKKQWSAIDDRRSINTHQPLDNITKRPWSLEDERQSVNKYYTPPHIIAEVTVQTSEAYKSCMYQTNNMSNPGIDVSKTIVNNASCMYSTGTNNGNNISTSDTQNSNNTNNCNVPSFARFGSLN